MTDLFIRCFASGIFALLSCSLNHAVLSDTWTAPRLTRGIMSPTQSERTFSLNHFPASSWLQICSLSIIAWVGLETAVSQDNGWQSTRFAGVT